MTTENNELENFKKDVSDIIEFVQLPKDSISTRDLRGQAMSSTELGYKIRLIAERAELLVTQAANKAAEEARLETAEELRATIYNFLHVLPLTMNDKQAISAIDYEFEEYIALTSPKKEPELWKLRFQKGWLPKVFQPGTHWTK